MKASNEVDENPTATLDETQNVTTTKTPAQTQADINQVASVLADQAFAETTETVSATVDPPAPVNDTVTEQEAETTETETPVETTATLEPTAPTQTQQTTEEEETTDEDITDILPGSSPLPVQAPQPLDASKFVDENGYVDVNKLSENINQTIASVQATATAAAQRELNAQRAEERAWSQATEKYPQLKSNRELRDIVQNARIGRATEMYRQAGAIQDPTQRQTALDGIRVPSPLAIAKNIFDFAAAAKTEGVRSATEQTRIAETAHVETSDTVQPVASKKEQLWGKIGDSRDPIGAQKAQTELLKSLLFPE